MKTKASNHIDADTLEMFEEERADPAFIALLQQALAAREGFDLRWRRADD